MLGNPSLQPRGYSPPRFFPRPRAQKVTERLSGGVETDSTSTVRAIPPTESATRLCGACGDRRSLIGSRVAVTTATWRSLGGVRFWPAHTRRVAIFFRVPRIGHFHAPALPLWRRLRAHGGDACGAGGRRRHHAAIEELVCAAGVELQLVDGPDSERWTNCVIACTKTQGAPREA